jgi:hypothetical protein
MNKGIFATQPDWQASIATAGKCASKIALIALCLQLVACNDSGNIVVTDSDSEVLPPDSSGSPGTVPDLDANPQIPETAGTPTVIVSDASVATLPAGTRAQAYAGSYGDGEGVFVINDDDRLIGLVESTGDQSLSVRADLNLDASPADATVSQFVHERQTSINSQISAKITSAFARQVGSDFQSSLELVDGQQINSLGGDIDFSLQVSEASTLVPVSAASLQGQWSSDFAVCDSNGEQCSRQVFSFQVSGVNFDGAAGVIARDGTDLLPSPISGSLAQRGHVVDVELLWNTYRYKGFAFVKQSQPDQLYLVLTTDSEIADARMLALTLARLQG